MTEKVKAVFDMLGVEPNEEFKFKSKRSKKSFVYRISEGLIVEYKESDDIWFTSSVNVGDFLANRYIITKLPQLTEADKNAIRYLRDGGMKYVARDIIGEMWAYKTKPIKLHEENEWVEENQKCDYTNVFKHLFQFVQWTDGEPFCIEDLEV